MDKCNVWELNDLVEYLPYTDRNLWETQRLLGFIDAQAHSTKKLSFQDICKFKWENEDDNEEVHNIEISNEDIERLKNLSRQCEGQSTTQET